MRDDPSETDEAAALDELFDAAAERIAAGLTVEPRDIIGDRTELHDRALQMIRLAQEASPSRPRIAIQVPGYEIIRELGSGGSGTVFLARQVALGGRPVAIKVLNPNAAMNARARERFLTEAMALARFRHPHLVQVFDVTSGPLIAIAMEWVDGRSLAEIIAAVRADREGSQVDAVARCLGAAPGTLPFESGPVFFCRTIIAVARALAAIHQAGLLHRDLKPSNILVRKDGTALLSDFGLVRDPEHSLHTETGVFVGTVSYAAPEQLRGHHQLIDVRSDVFSLGATLYECATLARAFAPTSEAESLRLKEAGAFLPPRQVDPQIRPDLEVIITKAIDPSPLRRYPDAAALADDLERFLTLRPIDARPLGPLVRAIRFARRHRATVVVALGVALLLSVALLTWTWMTTVRPEPVGHVRFIGLAPDLVVEQRSPGSDGRWIPRVTDPTGTVTLPVGTARLRVLRHNCFPLEIQDAFDISQNATIDQPLTTLPILQNTLPIGPFNGPPVLIPGRPNWKLVVCSGWGGSTVLDPISGRPVFSDSALGGLTRCCVRPGTRKQPPILIGLDATGRSLLSMPMETGGALVRARSESLGHGTFGVPIAIPDLDHDGVQEILVPCEDGTLVVLSGATLHEVATRLPAGDAHCVALATSAGPESSRQVFAAFEGPAGSFLTVVDPTAPSRPLSQRQIPPGTTDLWVLDAPTGRARALLQGRAGSFVVDPWTEAPPAQIGERGTTVVPVRLGSGEVAVCVATTSADRPQIVLSLSDQSGGRIWRSAPMASAPPFFLSHGDLDGEPGDEIVIGFSDGRIEAIQGTNGERQWTYRAPSSILYPPLIDDIDGDGFGDVLAATFDGHVHVLAGAAKHRHWVANVGWAMGGQPHLVRSGSGPAVVVAGGASAGSGYPFEKGIGMPAPNIRGFDARAGNLRWEQLAQLAFLVSPDFQDLDGDGIPDALAQDRSGRLVSFRGTDGIPGLVIPLASCADAFHYPRPRVIRSAGRTLIAACVSDRGTDGLRARVDAYDTRTGTLVWAQAAGVPAKIMTLAPGPDGAFGQPTVLCGAQNGGVIVLSAATGEILAHLLGDARIDAMTTGDVTGDGRADLIVADFGAKNGEVVVFDGALLPAGPRWTHTVLDHLQAAPTIGILGEGVLGIAAVDYEGNVHALDGKDGHELWATPSKVGDDAIYSSPVIADVDGMPGNEIVIGVKATPRYMVAVVDGRTGQVKRTIGTAAEVWGTALVADLDGNGRTYIVIGDEKGDLHAIPGRVP